MSPVSTTTRIGFDTATYLSQITENYLRRMRETGRAGSDPLWLDRTSRALNAAIGRLRRAEGSEEDRLLMIDMVRLAAPGSLGVLVELGEQVCQVAGCRDTHTIARRIDDRAWCIRHWYAAIEAERAAMKTEAA